MELYTFIMEYAGGTYISQVRSNDRLGAMRKWVEELDVKSIKWFSEKRKRKLIDDDFKDEVPVLLQECTNVWCFCLRLQKGIALINIIETKSGNTR